MKYFINRLLLIVLLIFSNEVSAQQLDNKNTIVQFQNGNLYAKLNNSGWLKLNDGGIEVQKKSSNKIIGVNNKSGADGQWVVSDYNSDYNFSGKNTPQKIANYKDSSILVSGFLANSTPNGLVFINRSTDRGKSWQQIFLRNVEFLKFTGFYKVQHPSPAHIITIAEKFIKDSAGNFERTYFLMTSSDTAKTWTVNDSVFEKEDIPYSFHFKGKYGMIRLESSVRNSILYSDNYGSTWEKYNLPSDLLNSFGNVTGKNSILLADYSSNKLGYTNNLSSGSWQYENLPDTFSVLNMDIRNKDTVWSAVPISSGVGDLQLSFVTGTTDGGKNWNTALNVLEKDSAIQARGLIYIDFATKNRGAAIGADVSYLTEDGGKSWKNAGFFDTLLVLRPVGMFYYYNPNTKKRLLMSLLLNEYIMKYDFEESTGLVDKQNIESQLKLYPNPTKNTLYLELPKDLALNNGTVTVLSIAGKEVGSFSLTNSNNGRHEISINNLPKGSYILQLRSNEYFGSKLFVKQ